jgi:hypothetical protein
METGAENCAMTAHLTDSKDIPYDQETAQCEIIPHSTKLVISED